MLGEPGAILTLETTPYDLMEFPVPALVIPTEAAQVFSFA